MALTLHHLDLVVERFGQSADDMLGFLRAHSLVDTDAGDAVMGFLAGNTPDLFRTVSILLAADR